MNPGGFRVRLGGGVYTKSRVGFLTVTAVVVTMGIHIEPVWEWLFLVRIVEIAR